LRKQPAGRLPTLNDETVDGGVQCADRLPKAGLAGNWYPGRQKGRPHTETDVVDEGLELLVRIDDPLAATLLAVVDRVIPEVLPGLRLTLVEAQRPGIIPAQERLLTEYEADLERSRELCSILADYGLLEQFTMQANLNQGGSLQIAGMNRVADKKLETLNAAQLKNLLKKGILARVYAHQLSLDNFARLLDRRAARKA